MEPIVNSYQTLEQFLGWCKEGCSKPHYVSFLQGKKNYMENSEKNYQNFTKYTCKSLVTFGNFLVWKMAHNNILLQLCNQTLWEIR